MSKRPRSTTSSSSSSSSSVGEPAQKKARTERYDDRRVRRLETEVQKKELEAAEQKGRAQAHADTLRITVSGLETNVRQELKETRDMVSQALAVIQDVAHRLSPGRIDAHPSPARLPRDEEDDVDMTEAENMPPLLLPPPLEDFSSDNARIDALDDGRSPRPESKAGAGEHQDVKVKKEEGVEASVQRSGQPHIALNTKGQVRGVFHAPLSRSRMSASEKNKMQEDDLKRVVAWQIWGWNDRDDAQLYWVQADDLLFVCGLPPKTKLSGSIVAPHQQTMEKLSSQKKPVLFIRSDGFESFCTGIKAAKGKGRTRSCVEAGCEWIRRLRGTA